MSLSLSRARSAFLGLVLFGLVCTVWVFLDARSTDEDRVLQDMKRRADTRHNYISFQLDAYVGALRNLGNLIRLQPELPHSTFREFARQEFVHRPGYFAIAWARCGPGQHPEDVRQLDALELAKPNPQAEVSFDPAALAPQFARAATSGKLVMSGLLMLSGPNGPVPGLAIVQPVFARHSTSPEASPPFLGYVLAFFEVGEVLGQSWRQYGGPVTDVLFVDGDAADPTLRVLYYFCANPALQALPPPTEAEFRSGWYREKTILFGERTWILLYRTTAGWYERQRSWTPNLLLGGGLTILLLFAAYLRSTTRRADLVEKQVSQRTAELERAQDQLREDIQQRESTEALLRASQHQLQGLMENSPSAIFVKDIEGRYLAVNRRFAELHGRARQDFVGATDFELSPPDIATRIRKSEAQVIAGAEPVESEESFVMADGTHTNLVHKFPLIAEDGSVHGLCGIATDISERKRAEADVRESRRQLESLLGQLPGMAFRCANDGHLTPVYVSRGAAGLTGYTARDFLERQITLEDIIHTEDRQRVREALAAAAKMHRSFEVEFRLVTRTGTEKWVLERGQGIHDASGALLFIEGLAIDITQRKDAESEKLLVERRLLEGQKLESIGVLAGGIAHDFNNLLTGILGNSNLAALDLPPGSPIHENLEQIESASKRAAELCQQMLAYAGKGRFVVQPVEIGGLVKNTVPLLHASISNRATLHFDLQPDLPPVLADATQMRQIVMNLVLNASEALSDRGGDIFLSTQLVHPSNAWFEGAQLAPPEIKGDFVRLEVRDTGCGMSAETLKKIFEPFFTTKFAGRGLGLAAVLGIVRSHRAGLVVRSVPGVGSTFALFLPAAPDNGERERPATVQRPSRTPWRGDDHLLIVDDEEHVRTVAASLLTSCGFTVETARDGYEALDLFRTRPKRFDLVILDMTMPRLSGEETLPLLREMQPDVRVLFMSGYNRRELVDSMDGAAMLGFIQKPFTLLSLKEHLQAMLGHG